MSLPDKPLLIKPVKIKLGEMRLFQRLGRKEVGERDMDKLAHFLEMHTNWTEDDADEMEFEEVVDLSNSIFQKFNESSVPKVTPPNSEPMPEARETPTSP